MKKLLIIGLYKNWEDAPILDESFEVWGMGSLWKKIQNEKPFLLKYFDMWWEIHTLETRSEEQLEWLKNTKIPVMAQEKFEEIPTSIKYPLDEISEKYRRYFLCTFNYQIAYAMYKGYNEIHLYGVNMIMNDDLFQRESFEYWLGRAEESGIKIVMPHDCDLLKSPKIYGYEADNTLAVYIEKYMNELKSSALKKIYDSCLDLQIAQSQLYELFIQKDKFMKSVIERHGLNIIKEDDEE